MFPVPPWQEEYNRQEFPEHFQDKNKEPQENDSKRPLIFILAPICAAVVAVIILSHFENLKLKISDNGVKIKFNN